MACISQLCNSLKLHKTLDSYFLFENPHIVTEKTFIKLDDVIKFSILDMISTILDKGYLKRLNVTLI